MDLVSVIITYYKKIKFIDKSVSSVLEQTYSNIEIIIIYDDIDKFELDYLVNKYKSNNKIKILVNEKNLGAGLSRNKGIEFSSGKYICFLDADDYWKKEKVENQINYMIKKNVDISHTTYSEKKKKDKFIKERKAKSFSNYKEILTSCDIGLSTVVLNKKIISEKIKFGNLKTKEDFVLWLTILKENIEIGGLDQNLSFWRKTNNSLSSSVNQKLIDGFRVYNKNLNFNFFKSLYLLICLSLNYLKKN